MITINKYLKIITISLGFVLCSYSTRIFVDWLGAKYLLCKRQIAASIIEGDLEDKDLTTDLKTKQQKKGRSLTHEEMQKVIWILDVQNEQLKNSLETVKSAIGYHEE